MSAIPEWLGASPHEVVAQLSAFNASSLLLSNDRWLADNYAQKWIGVYSGEVRAAEDELDSLIDSLDKQGIPRSDTIIRFIERNRKTLIL